ncbi:hypothetical protein BKG82_27030 [Mycobacteroides chelonae]|uniref:Uncharacterized protein n=1 Tax=Mycobacteroides chelonae TaxID=1774 RepID=A0A1S1LD11_MYCCH|nr:hypothetical protein [Mycobacteroides chelonae]OHU47308.1 hypothetical protein BKG82_27030 [Mycobacteroides chelonae]
MSTSGKNQFTLDASTARYDAVNFGKRWNGFETPTVTREVFELMIRTDDPQGQWYRLAFDQNGVATLHYLDRDGEDTTITPDAAGHYDLAVLGWQFQIPEPD